MRPPIVEQPSGRFVLATVQRELQVLDLLLVSFFAHCDCAGIASRSAHRDRRQSYATLLEELGQLANETAKKSDRAPIFMS
jgi:hypothetical protein